MRVSDQTLNRLAVLKAIRRDGPISRSQLPAITGLSGATITQMTADLLTRDLILETRESSKRPGRPRTNLEVNPGSAIVIGASTAADDRMSTGFVDLFGRHVFAHDMRLRAPDSLEEMVRQIADNLDAAIEASPFGRADISRIVLALPALVDSLKGEVHYMTTYPAKPTPFASVIAEQLGIPVAIENDVTRMARGEHWFGRARAFDSFTMLHVGHAVGSAQYAHGLPLTGANGLNTEIGHVKTAHGASARRCYCGARGCVSAYSSIYGMLPDQPPVDRDYVPGWDDMSRRFDALIGCADRGDTEARERLEQAGVHLGRVIAGLINSCDPGNLLILFGHRRLMDYARAPMVATIREDSFPGFLPRTNIIVDVTHDEWKWQGIAALALEQTYLARD